MIHDFGFESPWNALFLLSIPMLLALYLYRNKKRSVHLGRLFTSQTLQKTLTNFSPRRFALQAVLIGLALASMAVALMGPRGNPSLETSRTTGKDLFFVLDVSRSMLAADMKPNRLEKAKDYIRSMLPVLSGERVGLIIFAGSVALKSPLTGDYAFFQRVLSAVDTNSIHYGGTRIGDAIRAVTALIGTAHNGVENSGGTREVILITDGEDHNSNPIAAAREAAKQGIQLYTIGIGSPSGTPITIENSDPRQRQAGQNTQIISRLDEYTLQQIAQITDGIYIPAQTKQLHLGDIYADYITARSAGQQQSAQITIWQKYYLPFAFFAFCTLLCAWSFDERRAHHRSKNL